MQGLLRPLTRPLLVVLAGVIFPVAAHAADSAPLTKEQVKQFLQTAEVIKSKPSSKGITHPWRLTLSNGAYAWKFQPAASGKFSDSGTGTCH